MDAADNSYSAQRALVDEGLVALLARLLAPASPPAVRVAAARCVATVAGAARAVRAASASYRDVRSGCSLLAQPALHTLAAVYCYVGMGCWALHQPCRCSAAHARQRLPGAHAPCSTCARHESVQPGLWAYIPGVWPAAVSAAGAARLQRGSSLGFGETPDRVTFNPAQAELADREVLRCWRPGACFLEYARSHSCCVTALQT